MPAKVERPRLIVGIDFGTTFSGVAWGMEDCQDDIEVIQTWPGGGNTTSQKIPTLLLYDGKRMKWGYEAEQSVHPGNQHQLIQGVKLLMDEGQEFRYAPASESGKLIKQMGKSAVQVSGDYLASLVTHAREMLRRRFGAALQTFDLHYILTVPAVWSDKGKNSTMQAAHLAKIPAANLTLLSEPEAAAVYAIRTIQPNTIAEGDCLIVCDAGGGTVDIITYRVRQTEPLIFEEATEGTGAVCGSVMLDERFDDLVKTIIEQKSAKGLPAASARAARRYWQDYIKPKYAGPVSQDEFDDPGYWVPIPGVSGIREVDLSEGHLYLEKDQVKEIFDPIVQQIEELLAEQRRNIKDLGLSTKAIILVGGLGASEYLFKCLEASDGVQIMQPPNAWSAVVRGAVYRGQEGNQVEGRISRCSYGTEVRVPFDPKIHGAEFTPTLCRFEEAWYVHGQMRWYIKKMSAPFSDKDMN